MKFTYSAAKDQEKPLKYNGKTGSLAVDEVINDINQALLQAVELAGNMVNRQRYEFQPANPPSQEATAMKNAGHGGLDEIKLHFSNQADSGGFFPLQGLTARGAGNSLATLGEVGSDKSQSIVSLDMSGLDHFVSVTVLTGVKEVKQQQKKNEDEPAFESRIIGLVVQGQNQEAGLYRSFFANLEGTKALRDLGTKLSKIEIGYDTFLDGVKAVFANTDFTVTSRKTPVKIELVKDNKPWQRIVDFETGALVGGSGGYMASLSMLTALLPGDTTIDSKTVSSVSFLLPFRQVTLPKDEAGSYEIDFEAGVSDKHVIVFDQETGTTLSVPSVSLSVLGVSGAVGSPFSRTKTTKDTKQDEIDTQTVVTEKFSINLPSTFYRLVNFTGTRYQDVAAQIYIVAGEKLSKIYTVNLGDKILLASDEEGVAKTIIAAI